MFDVYAVVNVLYPAPIGGFYFCRQPQPTAYISYHKPFLLSTVFFNFFGVFYTFLNKFFTLKFCHIKQSETILL
jgi:hypothetical protein